MGLPTITDNLQGYEQAQLLNKVENIKNKMYYLIHGTLDDNVHYQQSLMLAKVLEQRDILFRQQVRLRCSLFIASGPLSLRDKQKREWMSEWDRERETWYSNKCDHEANCFADLHGRRSRHRQVADTPVPLAGELFGRVLSDVVMIGARNSDDNLDAVYHLPHLHTCKYSITCT